MRRISTPKRFFALILGAGTLTGGLALSDTTASAVEPVVVTASAPQTHSTDDATTTGWFDRFKRDWCEATRKYNKTDQRAARYFR